MKKVELTIREIPESQVRKKKKGQKTEEEECLHVNTTVDRSFCNDCQTPLKEPEPFQDSEEAITGDDPGAPEANPDTSEPSK